MIGRRLVALSFLAVAPAVLQAQVGLASGASQIALIARAAPQASINGVSPTQETARRGALSEGTVKVRLSANTGYRLVVVGTAPLSSTDQSASRVWVRAENGRFEELRSGGSVTVAHELRGAGEREREVRYRTESSEIHESAQALPVRYELRVEPTI
jgi:hypothetical protein